MNSLFQVMWPEMILCGMACVLFLLGVSSKVAARRLAPMLALLTLVFVFAMQLRPAAERVSDQWNTVRIDQIALYIKLITAGVGVIFVLLAWPTNAKATGNSALDFGEEAGEFFGLMLLSLAGVMIVAGANDIMLLFLGIELAAIPTYIMVSISRPLPVAQEAGVKYFFLGAMAAAVMLFGFSYLYGATGMTHLDEIGAMIHGERAINLLEPGNHITPFIPASGILPPIWGGFLMLAVVMLIAGFSFKMAAVPLHFYAGDVYQGAATPVTAFLSFVPKTSGIVALIKILATVGGASFAVPHQIVTLLWVIAVLSMSVGNMLGLLQHNVKRVLAYSSIAHSGYMLVGVTALLGSPGNTQVQQDALRGVMFYLAAYGVMNAGTFGVLMLLPARKNSNYTGSSRFPLPATSAETFEDIAGQGRRHPGLGMAMAVCCFSLIGIPLTVGFVGKLLLIKPALDGGMYWLVILTMVNAAISAAYYLRIVATMFLRPEPTDATYASEPPAAIEGSLRLAGPLPIALAVALSVAGTLVFGAILPATARLTARAEAAAQLRSPFPIPSAVVRVDK